MFFVGLWLSTMGTWAHNTAVVLLVRQLGGDGIELGIAAACQFGPMLVLGLKAGAIADASDRHRRTIRLSVLLAATALAFGALVLADSATLGVVYAMTLVFGLFSALENPTRRSLVTELVPADQVGNVLSLNTSVMTGGRMFGPAVAAVLASAAGIGWVFVFNGATYVAILVALHRLDRTRLHRVETSAPSRTPVRDGLQAIWSVPELRVTLAVFAVGSTFAYTYTVGLPLLVTERLGEEQAFYGWLLSAMSVGNVIGALVVARLDRISVRWVLGAGVALGVTLSAVSLMTDATAALVAVTVFGVAAATFANANTIIVQQRIDPRVRSRALALTSVLFIGSTPVGGPITGAVGDIAGAVWANLYGGLVSIAAAVVALLLAPRLHVHTRESERT